MNRNSTWVICTGVLCLALACGGGGGQGQPQVQSFPLTTCDQDQDCNEGFHCSPVYCEDKCLPDGRGKCLPCNGGKVGECLPNPPTPCDEVNCPPGDQCVLMCNGACDPAAGECKDVACVTACVPAPEQCRTDADCGSGRHCEFLCLKGCTEPAFAGAGASRADRCPDMECLGTCVDDPPEPVKCSEDADCPEGFVCEPVLCPMMCAPDGQGGCLPCNDGFLGQCVPKPVSGCQTDVDCQAGEFCQVVCTGVCDAFAAGAASDSSAPCWEQECFGQCMPMSGCAGVDCGPGYQCIEVCAACPEPRFATGTPKAGEMPPCGECLPQCVPVGPQPGPCNDDGDCPAGHHCEPVFCDMACVPDGQGGCLPCNDGFLGQCVPDAQQGCRDDAECAPGEKCQVYCMGLCDPTTGCGEVCQGVCVAQGGCTSDDECGEGFHCEWVCTAGCGYATPDGAPRSTDPASPPCDPTMGECFGQCVPNPPPEQPCDTDADCPAGFVCEPVLCVQAESCLPDASGECVPLPCNEGHLGVCVPAPQEGCQSDEECALDERCEVYCTGLCDPASGCGEVCFGQCVLAGCGGGCPEGFECVTACPDCPPGRDCRGECIEECVTVPPPADQCNQDSDCPPGFHCEPVLCTMDCIPDDQGGCLPCNDGFLGRCEPDAQQGCGSDADCAPDERCEVVCTGRCPPGAYCTDACFGVCVKKEAGCQADSDCPEGFYCELVCPADCGPAPAGAEAPACIGAECVGQCLPRPAECSSDADCPAGFTCVEQENCPPCAYSDPACGMPCWTQKVCVPKPTQGCRADSDCQPWQKCEFVCPMACTPEDCDEYCMGRCVDLPD